MITVYTPFQRKENIELMANVLKDKAHWVVLIDDPELKPLFPDWVEVKLYDKPQGDSKSNQLLNHFIRDGLGSETQYMVLCDDDSVEEGFFDKIPDEDVVCVSMKRGDQVTKHVSWDDYEKQQGHWIEAVDILMADPLNMKVARVGGEQLILKGKVLRDYRYGLNAIGDGQMIEKIKEERVITYIPDAYVLFNYFEDGRFKSFKRHKSLRVKPLVLFVGDYYCAGNPQMGYSEWEGNIWNSLHSTGLASVMRFHYDLYYYANASNPNWVNVADQALIDAVVELEPDYIVLIVYKPLGSDPTVIRLETLGVLKEMGVKIITIWGDLEAQQQIDIAKTVAPFTWKNYGTANKQAVESIGFKYTHVPKDSAVWNNPNLDRDIDVLFFGSYGLGREERQHALQYLIDNGIKLRVGGSEGRDHYTTADYADGFKRAKIALSFSRAHGMSVVNARVFEAMNCGAMLMEQKSDQITELYEENKDFVMWISEVDLLDKVKYYLANETERAKIAKSGYEKTLNEYSAKAFWEDALKE